MGFFHNYVSQCNKSGVSPSAAAEAMGFTRSMVTRWKNGSVPRRATLQKMMDYFECSLESLVRENKDVTECDGLSEQEQELVNLFRAVDSQSQNAILHYLRRAESNG